MKINVWVPNALFNHQDSLALYDLYAEVNKVSATKTPLFHAGEFTYLQYAVTRMETDLNKIEIVGREELRR